MGIMEFGAVFNYYLIELGLTAREVAKRTGFTEQYISQVRKGSDPTFARAVAIIDALGVDIDEFADKCAEDE